MMWGAEHDMSAAAVVWCVVLAVVVVAIVIGIVLLVRGYAGRGGASAGFSAPPAAGAGAAQGLQTGETPLQVLERRYAQGDIDREEFLQRRSDLKA